MSDTPYIDVNVAKRNQLFSFAKNELGLDVKPTMTKDELRDVVAKQLGQNVTAGDSPEPTGLVEKNLRNLRNQKKVTIRIADDPGYPKMVYVGVNGVDYNMQRGKWIDVPEAVVHVLENAVQTIITQQEMDGKVLSTQQRKLTYMFEVKR